MRLTKIYTKTGDKGETGLVGGKRVSKDAERVEAFGTVDELNALLGVVRGLLGTVTEVTVPAIDPILHKIQNALFIVGSDLATIPGPDSKNQTLVQEKQIEDLEGWIDGWQAELEPLPEFILPGGGVVGAHLHLARTVCRRAERITVSLSKKEEVRAEVLQYLNRLSDLLFVLARWVNQKLGEKEHLWNREL